MNLLEEDLVQRSPTDSSTGYTNINIFYKNEGIDVNDRAL